MVIGDLPLAQRRAEDALQDPAVDDPISLGLLRTVLAQAYTLTGQPERAVSIAREGRQEAAELGIEFLVANFCASEAVAWTAAGDYAAVRPPASGSPPCARNPARRHRNHRRPDAAEPAGNDRATLACQHGRADCSSRCQRCQLR
ncbi:MAG TPA: hypothetical protein VEF71_02245 [Streptosporangiaceae bacterium]|nr:hypothetical protein [Streptosporangiaceae bacterium]